MTLVRALFALAFLAVGLGLFPATAFAEPGSVTAESTDDKERARAHFARGVALYREHNLNGSLAEFNRAYAIAPSWRILFNIGQVRLEMHDWAGALRAYERYLAEAGSEAPADKRAEASAGLARCRELVAEVSVRVVGGEEGAEVTVDEIVVGKVPLGEPFLVGTGRHKIAVTGVHEPTVKSIEVAGGDRVLVELIVPSVSAAAPAPTRSPSVEGVTTVPTSTAARGRAPYWIGLGVTGALAVATASSAFLSLRASQELDRELDAFPTNEARVTSARTKLRTTALVTDVLLASTIASGGIAGYLFFTRNQGQEKGSLKVQVGVGTVGVHGVFQ